MTQKREHVLALNQEGISIQKASGAMDLLRSSWYYKRKAKEQKRSARPLDETLVKNLNELQDYELTLGYRKISVYLRFKCDLIFNHKKVYRHMKRMHILQPKVIRRPGKKKLPTALWYCPLQSNVRWESDLTLVPYESGFLYLFTVIDVFDKEVVGSWFGFRCQCSDAIAALENAIKNRFPDGIPEGLELVLRLDRGCQFTAYDFMNAAREFRIKIEFCDAQSPNQKPFIESFFSNFKREEVYRNSYSYPLQAFQAWKSYVDWYNSKRPHSALHFLSPAQFRAKNLEPQILSS